MTREEQIIEAAAEATYQEPPQYSKLVHKTRKVMSAYEVGFIDGCVWADSHLNWTRIEDSLPKRVLSCEPIIDVIMANAICVGQGRYNDITGQWTWHATGIIANDITHWMPMPQIPEPLETIY